MKFDLIQIFFLKKSSMKNFIVLKKKSSSKDSKHDRKNHSDKFFFENEKILEGKKKTKKFFSKMKFNCQLSKSQKQSGRLVYFEINLILIDLKFPEPSIFIRKFKFCNSYIL